MIIHDCEQGTAEWLALRAGIPTASAFDKIITPKTAKASQSAEPYMFTLLAERMMGRPISEHLSFWMERGSQMEAEAKDFYRFQRDVETQPVGFITNDAGTVGASPDDLVGDDGLLEIKCPKPSIHVAYLLQAGGAYNDYKVQVQGQLWVTGRQWCDVLAYDPELPPALVRIERDEEYIKKLAAAVTAFSGVLERYYLELVERGWVKDKPKPREKSAVELLKEELCKMNG